MLLGISYGFMFLSVVMAVLAVVAEMFDAPRRLGDCLMKGGLISLLLALISGGVFWLMFFFPKP